MQRRSFFQRLGALIAGAAIAPHVRAQEPEPIHTAGYAVTGDISTAGYAVTGDISGSVPTITTTAAPSGAYWVHYECIPDDSNRFWTAVRTEGYQP